MTEEQFKSYIDTIKDHPKFKKLDKFIKMTKLLEDKDIKSLLADVSEKWLLLNSK